MLGSMSRDAERLGEECRRWLLFWARRSIRLALYREPAVMPSDCPPEAQAPRACFVSLHTRTGLLRGCIGTFDEGVPLWRNVAGMAVAAATRDHRFAPLERTELDDCVIEISVLTPRVPLAAAEVVVGKHGLWVACGGRHGVLLPQVPVSYGWDRETFLDHTCLKAGLPRKAWREHGTRLEAFCAEVFDDADPCGDPVS